MFLTAKGETFVSSFLFAFLIKYDMKIFGAVFAVVGCVVGIGFVSGKELSVFFKNSNPLFVSWCFFVLFFCVTLLLFILGKKTDADDVLQLNKKLFGKWNFIFDFVFVFTCFLACTVMLAGVQGLWVETMGGEFCFSLLVALFCAVSLCFALKSTKSLNVALVVVVVVIVVLVCLSDFKINVQKDVDVVTFVKVAKYVCFNCMLGASVFLSCSKTLCKKQFVFALLISSFVLSLLIFLILSSIGGGEMPMVEVAKNSGLLAPFVCAVFCGAIVALRSCSLTVVKWVQDKSGDKIFSVVVVYICAYVVSLFGFGKILSVMLPVSSVFALLFVLCGVLKLAKNKGNG